MKMLTIAELAKELNIKDCTVRKLIRQGLPCMQHGKKYYFELVVVEKWLRKHLQVNK